MPCLRHTSLTGIPASASFKIDTIWVSVNLLFRMGTSRAYPARKFSLSVCQFRGRLRADFLPGFIVEQKQLYGILSDGLHNRSEEECQLLFNPCLEGIKLALDQLEVERARVERIAKAKAELNSVAEKIRKME